MRSFPEVEVWQMMTPSSSALRLPIGPVDQGIVEDMKSLDYDYAPVFIDGEQAGLIPRSRLAELAQSGEPLSENDSSTITASVVGSVELDELLLAMEQFGALNVRSLIDRGFITVSDLNKHQLRSKIYPLFAELESELAIRVKEHFSDPWHWLRILDEDKQARLIGYWELSKRKHVDIGPLAGTTFSELTRIFGSTDALRTRLGFPSKSKWDQSFGNLVELRNSIMHPVRPLFSSIPDVAATRLAVEKILDLLNQLGQSS